MNADLMRSIIREELQTALAAFFVTAPVPPAVNQDLEDRIQHAQRLPFLLAETARQRAASAERKARKAERRAV